MDKCCGICKHYKPDARECVAAPIFPDASYAIAPGQKRKMRPNDGMNCQRFSDGNN